MKSEDIIEIDSLEELSAWDESYKGYGSLGREEIQDGE